MDRSLFEICSSLIIILIVDVISIVCLFSPYDLYVKEFEAVHDTTIKVKSLNYTWLNDSFVRVVITLNITNPVNVTFTLYLIKYTVAVNNYILGVNSVYTSREIIGETVFLMVMYSIYMPNGIQAIREAENSTKMIWIVSVEAYFRTQVLSKCFRNPVVYGVDVIEIEKAKH